MKKLRLILPLIAVIVISAVALAGCSNTPAHKVLADTWLNGEVATYEMTRDMNDNVKEEEKNAELIIKGEMVITTERIKNKTITVGDNNIDNFNGTLVTYEGSLEDGTVMNAKVAFNSNLVPVAAYKYNKIKGYSDRTPAVDTEQILKAKYQGKDYKYEASVNEEKYEGTIALGDWNNAPYFDNLMLYHIGRATFTGDNGTFNPITFNAPFWNEKALKSLSMSFVNTEELNCGGKEKVKADKVMLKSNQTFPAAGAPNYVYYAKENTFSGIGSHLMLKAQEGEITYLLTSVKAL